MRRKYKDNFFFDLKTFSFLIKYEKKYPSISVSTSANHLANRQYNGSMARQLSDRR